ncbi:hypothetical protein HDU98_009135 [Podochytrium sp. JEL0797]|nr:hypothetical protein HDU98_009135 [Podochytrium sp. JEL0797]
MPSLSQVALVVGASRGIGAHIALALAADGATVVVSSRKPSPTEKPDSTTPPSLNSPKSTIYSVSSLINSKGLPGKAFPIECDVCDDKDIESLIKQTMTQFGRIDTVVYNAGAIHWGKVAETPFKKFQLMNRVNAVGLYKVVDTVLPIFTAAKSGRFLVVSPPIYSRFFRGKTAYAMGKVAMTVLTNGLGMDFDELNKVNGGPGGLAITSLWPATAVQSAVTEVKNIPLEHLRHASIFADAVVGICNEPASKVNGLALIDEDYLREFKGVSDFKKYQLSPGIEPTRMMPKKFPSLLVEEQEDRGFSVSSKSKL